jgi:hypothetical protein
MGFRDAESIDFLAFRIHGVDQDFVDEMMDLGLERLTPDQALRLKTHHVNRSYRDKMEGLGLSNFTADRLVAMKLLHVDRRLANRLASERFEQVSISQLLDRNGGNTSDWLDDDLRAAVESVVRDLTK